ncbi:hypothetical protein [Gloeobacter violaceus]|uniref:Glr1550 protein n=1 Tax=Gloeobacter violaceus (strain ATCC 29082 / PCC 7421) TaxID=251221 RepID=Q7NKC8_GLOVI|nr:hypothetical protein [Gloeobacter violaceus]BAC89491.1 glr1550 [Gloeobacter violaceus PCC 7421]
MDEESAAPESHTPDRPREPVDQEALAAYWKCAAEEAEQLCLEQMEIARQAHTSRQEAESALIVQRQTIASQQAELSELRRNFDRSSGIIRSLEQRLATLQEQLTQRPAASPQWEARIAEADRCIREHASAAEQAQARLLKANERIIALERQLLQLKGVLERSASDRCQSPLSLPESIDITGTNAPIPKGPPRARSGHSLVRLPAFLETSQDRREC